MLEEALCFVYLSNSKEASIYSKHAYGQSQIGLVL